jgi:hypothetical protein
VRPGVGDVPKGAPVLLLASSSHGVLLFFGVEREIEGGGRGERGGERERERERERGRRKGGEFLSFPLFLVERAREGRERRRPRRTREKEQREHCFFWEPLRGLSLPLPPRENQQAETELEP